MVATDILGIRIFRG